jgi:hypothetical protein
MVETAFALFVVAVLLVVAFWIGGLIVDRLPASDATKNVFRLIGLLLMLFIVFAILLSFLPGHQPLWLRRW